MSYSVAPCRTAIKDMPSRAREVRVLDKRINLEWNLVVARTSGNEPLVALIEAIAMPIRDAQDYQHVTTPELRSAAVKAHAAILKAIREKDEDAAFKRMERNVTAYRDIATPKQVVA